MASKKIIIIGAGIAGLAAGCYARMNGYDTEIFEMHNIPGGLCTAWERKGYIFDGCIHFLVGTNPEDRLNVLWNEVGALDGVGIVDQDIYLQIEGAAGEKLLLYTDLDRLEKHMAEISPADAALSQELVDAIRQYPAIAGIRLMRIGMRAFANEFQNPFLREALSMIGNVEFFLMTMNSYSRRDAGWPIGGSLELAKRMEKRFLKLGGNITYKARVEEIVAENGRATGVRLADGKFQPADFVISAADGYATIYQMLQGKYVDDGINDLYTNAKTVATSVQVSLGIGCDLSDEPHDVVVRLDPPIPMMGVEKSHIAIKHYCYDKSLSPKGKSVVSSLIPCDFEYWRALSVDKAAYAAEKEKLAAAFIQVVEKRFPQTRGKVEVTDVATPMTYSRYTGAWKGAYMGWLSTPERPVTSAPGTLPGLEGFYMAGQWTYPSGGLPIALVTARKTLQKLCVQDGRTFVSRTK